VRGTRQPTLSADFVVVRTGRLNSGNTSAKASEAARMLIKKAGKALKNPGINKDAVFKRGMSGLFAYSVDTENPHRIVRRSAGGKKVIGRVVQGRFKAG
jgi:hypothetical protein